MVDHYIRQREWSDEKVRKQKEDMLSYRNRLPFFDEFNEEARRWNQKR